MPVGYLTIEEEYLMDSKVQNVLAEYDARLERELVTMRTLSMEAIEARKNDFLIPIGRQSAEVLTNLIKGQGAQSIVELGASYGYSTIWFAEAARATGGRVISLELDASKVAYIRPRLEAAGLTPFVEFRIGDAREQLRSFDVPIDFVLIDLWKDLYIPCFDLLLPHLARGAFVAADNILQPAIFREMGERYRQHVRASDRFDSVLLPVGSGIELSRLRD
jgi:predicted O-methyltransferase YrrM